RKAAAFLWNMRASQWDAMARQGEWQLTNQDMHNPYFYSGQNLSAVMQSRPFERGADLIRTMLPHNVQLIPTSLVFFLLLIFVAIIGPFDYIVLGRLKLRRLTWVLFPAVCIVFTLITVNMSSYFLGTKDHARSLNIFDMGSQGDVLRQTQLDLIFPAKRKTMHRKVSKRLFTKVSDVQFQHQYTMGGQKFSGDETPKIQGRMPGQFEFDYQLQQWKPVLFKFLGIPGAENLDTSFPWKVPAAHEVDSRYFDSDKLKSRFRELNKNFIGDVYVLHKNNIHRHKDYNRYEEIVPRHIVQDLSAHHLNGFFSVVSQTSPSGGETFEDLTIMDRTSKDAWLLVLVNRQGDAIDIYRYLYQKERKWHL
ncbi:MAG: hypothetical protein AAF492_28175, partial [Verrucomicrobiota bacterium]